MTVTAASRRESRCDFGVSHTTPTRPDPTRPLYQWSPLHACRHLGNARRPFSRIAEALMGWLGDDMDAATRRRFA